MPLRSNVPIFRLLTVRGRLVCLVRPCRWAAGPDHPRLVALVAGGRPPFLRRLALHRAVRNNAPKAA